MTFDISVAHAHEQKRVQRAAERVGAVLKVVSVGVLIPAQLFVSRLGTFGDHRRSKAESRIFRSAIVILS